MGPREARVDIISVVAAKLRQALACHQQGRWADAEVLYREILTQVPSHFDALHWLGTIEMQKGNAAAAVDLIGRAIRTTPDNAPAHSSFGNALRILNQPEAALASYDRALALMPDYPEALANRGVALRDLGRHADALASFDRALALRPAFAEALYNRGNALRDLKRPEEALASYDRALARRPAFAEALTNRGNALHDLKRYEEALATQDAALALKPDFAEALYNRGNALRELKRPAEALASYDRALAVNPGYLEALINRANAQMDLKRHEEALESFGRALALAPNDAGAHWNECVCRLLTGDFERGWPRYEWRWQYELGPTRREFAQPQWSGGYLDGVLLAWGEQGLGEQILHLSMLRDLARLASQLIVAVDARLVPLVQRSFPQVTAIALNRSIEGVDCDAHVPLGDLGQYLRRGWGDFPRESEGAYLFSDETRSRELREQIAPEKELVCGLSWTSKSEKTAQHKSIALRDLQPILRVPGIRFVDLQYGDTRQERDALGAEVKRRLVHMGGVDNFNDVDGLAALINACDVVVTVSNTTAHLAGALGKRVFLMLPFSRGRHWYWHEDRDDSPWYPTVRLFRQPAVGDWAGVIQLVRGRLDEELAAGLNRQDADPAQRA